MSEEKRLLEIKNLSVEFGSGARIARAVRDASWFVKNGETVGLVGESGCGKSVTGLSVLRLIEAPGKISAGSIMFNGQDLLDLKERDMRSIRGKQISMIFQEPMTSFNPVFTIGDQLTEAIMLHEDVTLEEAWTRSVEMLKEVGIPLPEQRMEQYPHELSGGMKQRAMIAMALLCNPKLVIADEPTTALDVTVQAQILDLLQRIQKKHGMSVILITHDLSVVAQNVERVYVMYASAIVESAKVEELFERPLHPYTQGLFKCLPRVDGNRNEELYTIPGTVPDPAAHPSGCRFHPRCPIADERCKKEEPVLEEKYPGHICACHKVEKS